MTFTTTTGNEVPATLTGLFSKQIYNATMRGAFVPFNYLTNLKLIIDIEKAISGQNNHIANAIRLSVKEEPAVVTLAMIKDMANDNITMMQDKLGLDLVKRITNEL